MNAMKTLLAIAVVIAMSADTQAGRFGKRRACGASKCCDCAPTFQPNCCKPTIVRPCHRNVYNYQRSCAKPRNCCGNAPGMSCCPVNNGCNNGGCDTGCTTGCTTGACGTNCCSTAPVCSAPCGTACGNTCCNNILSNIGCAAPCGNGCSACGNNNCDGACGSACGNTCCDTACGNGNNCCDTGCGDNCCETVCCDNACVIAELIYQSQTACYARHRRAAVHKLGDKFDCRCNPEIMSALIYALNDADQRVRAKAADEIGDQLRRNPCCCSSCVVSALTNALADCDRRVRREAEQGLRLCGYDVVDGCCEEVCCDTQCCSTGGNNCDNGCINGNCAPVGVPAEVAPAVPAAPAPMPVEAAPATEAAPAPPAEERAYFPKRLPEQEAKPLSARRSLSKLFSFAR